MLELINQTILIVEDEPLNLQLLIVCIKELSKNITIYTADNGTDAYVMLRNHKPDVVITDWEMPHLNGIELTSIIRTNSEFSYIPIIMCTGKNNSPENIRYAFSKGVSDFITKPFNKIELLARIKSQLMLSQSYQTIINQKKELELEKIKSDMLIKSILPESIALELKNNHFVKPKLFKNVSVYYSDIIEFTRLSNTMNLIELINELNEIFTHFDNIMSKNHCERIKTVGDAYIAVCGMHEQNKDHALNITNAAFEILSYLADRNAKSKNKWKIRTGIHTGNLIGGIVGKSKFIYDIFGETINIASRLENASESMKILVSKKTYKMIQSGFLVEEKLNLNVKGIGEIDAFFIAKK